MNKMTLLNAFSQVIVLSYDSNFTKLIPEDQTDKVHIGSCDKQLLEPTMTQFNNTYSISNTYSIFGRKLILICS